MGSDAAPVGGVDDREASCIGDVDGDGHFGADGQIACARPGAWGAYRRVPDPTRDRVACLGGVEGRGRVGVTDRA